MTASVLLSDKPGLRSLAHKYPLAVFFLLVLGLTWPFMIVDALGSHDILPFRLPIPLMIVMGYMPALAAVIVTGMTKGREGIRTLFGKLLICESWISMVHLRNLWLRCGLRWCNRIVQFIRRFCHAVSFREFPEIFQSLGNDVIRCDDVPRDQPGQWRGTGLARIRLPRLQAKYSALTSSLILGVIWALFHLPLFFTLTGYIAGGSQFHRFFDLDRQPDHSLYMDV